VLGVFGDPAGTGKPAGDDLREGKRTVLVALASQSSSAAQARLLERHLGDPGLDEAGVAVLREIIVATGALAEVERMIRNCTEQAVAALAVSPVDPCAEVALHELATAATVRTL
jgi:geranylgeranyl diphosphate synthase type I